MTKKDSVLTYLNKVLIKQDLKEGYVINDNGIYTVTYEAPPNGVDKLGDLL